MKWWNSSVLLPVLPVLLLLLYIKSTMMKNAAVMQSGFFSKGCPPEATCWQVAKKRALLMRWLSYLKRLATGRGDIGSHSHALTGHTSKNKLRRQQHQQQQQQQKKKHISPNIPYKMFSTTALAAQQ